MLALAHQGDDAYGVTIRREIEARTGRTMAIGAVYATLARLEEKGLVRFRDLRSPAGAGRTRQEILQPDRSRRARAPPFDRDAGAHDGRAVAGFTGRPVMSKPRRAVAATARAGAGPHAAGGGEPRLSRRGPGGGIRRARRDRGRRRGPPLVLEAGLSVRAAPHSAACHYSDRIANDVGGAGSAPRGECSMGLSPICGTRGG